MTTRIGERLDALEVRVRALEEGSRAQKAFDAIRSKLGDLFRIGTPVRLRGTGALDTAVRSRGVVARIIDADTVEVRWEGMGPLAAVVENWEVHSLALREEQLSAKREGATSCPAGGSDSRQGQARKALDREETAWLEEKYRLNAAISARRGTGEAMATPETRASASSPTTMSESTVASTASSSSGASAGGDVGGEQRGSEPELHGFGIAALDLLREFVELTEDDEEAQTVGTGLYVVHKQTGLLFDRWNTDHAQRRQKPSVQPRALDAAREYLYAAAGDMPQPGADVAVKLLAEYAAEQRGQNPPLDAAGGDASKAASILMDRWLLDHPDARQLSPATLHDLEISIGAQLWGLRPTTLAALAPSLTDAERAVVRIAEEVYDLVDAGDLVPAKAKREALYSAVRTLRIVQRCAEPLPDDDLRRQRTPGRE